MNEGNKKLITKLYSVAIIILAAVFTVLSVMPVMVFDIDEFNFDMGYRDGRFTSKTEQIEDAEIGLITVVDAVKNWDDLITVMNIQILDQSIEGQENFIKELENKSYDEEYIAGEVQELNEMIADRDVALSKLTEDDIKRIEDKIMNDDSFNNVIGDIYGIIGAFGKGAGAMVESSSDLGTDILRITEMVLGIIILVSLIGVSLVFPIIVVIKFIVFLIKSLAHLKDDDVSAVDARSDKFPFTTFAAMMLMFHMLYALVSTGVKIGIAVNGAVAVLLVVCILRAIRNILFEENKSAVVIKQAITVVSIIAAALLLVNFIGIDLINEYDDVISVMSLEQYDAELEALKDSGLEDYQMERAAEDAVSKSNGINTAIIVSLTLLGAMLIVVALINGVERFAEKKMKLKTGELVPYKAMIVLGAFLLALAIVPTVFAVDSKDALDEARKAGQFKVWYAEYKEEGTAANLNYELLKATAEDGDEAVADLRDKLNGASGEEAEKLERELKVAEHNLATVKERVDDIEARATRPTVCIITAVVFLISEIAYLVVTKKTAPKAKDKKEETEEAVAAE